MAVNGEYAYADGDNSSAPETDNGSGLASGAKAGTAVGVSAGVISAALDFGKFF